MVELGNRIRKDVKRNTERLQSVFYNKWYLSFDDESFESILTCFLDQKFLRKLQNDLQEGGGLVLHFLSDSPAQFCPIERGLKKSVGETSTCLRRTRSFLTSHTTFQ